jgi:methyl-accepting chemotaxis protein
MFADLKVGTRLALAFGAVLLLLVGMLLTGVNRLSVVNEHLHAILDVDHVLATDEIDVLVEAQGAGASEAA